MLENILIRGVNWVGDAVMTMPAIGAVRRAFPESKISLLVKPLVAPLFEKDPNVDEIILYTDDFRGVGGRLRLAKALREKGFSLALLLQNAFDAALIAFLARIPARIGYGRDARSLLLTKPIAYDGQDRKIHHIDYYLQLLRKADIDAPYCRPWIYLDIEERLRAEMMLRGLRRPVVGINPGASYGSAKEWPPERFKEAIGGILKDLKGSVVVFGLTDVLSVSGENVLNLSGKTTLRELAALVARLDALLTNDSGPMHVGYAVGTPVVAVFGSTEPSLTGPVGGGSAVLKKDMACSPCFERECKSGTPKCMEAVTPDEALESLRRIIPGNRAVFFDRDGTLCEDANYLREWDKFRVFPEIDALGALKAKGFKLIGVSNQSGIRRGIVEEAFVREVHALFTDRYGFDGFYHCPHHPDERCSCRKPEPGMLMEARAEHSVDLKSSFVVGDRESDMLLAKAAGARGVLVRTGDAGGSENADFVANDLREAADWILKNS